MVLPLSADGGGTAMAVDIALLLAAGVIEVVVVVVVAGTHIVRYDDRGRALDVRGLSESLDA